METDTSWTSVGWELLKSKFENYLKNLFCDYYAILLVIMRWNGEHRAFVIETYLKIATHFKHFRVDWQETYTVVGWKCQKDTLKYFNVGRRQISNGRI